MTIAVDSEVRNQTKQTNQGRHCLRRQNQSSEKEIEYFLEIITCDPSIYTMDHPHPVFMVSSSMVIPLVQKGLKKSSVPTSSGNHGKSPKKNPCMEKSWNLKKTCIIMEKSWNFAK